MALMNEKTSVFLRREWRKSEREEIGDSFHYAFESKLVRALSSVGSKLKILTNMSSGRFDIQSICSSAITEIETILVTPKFFLKG